MTDTPTKALCLAIGIAGLVVSTFAEPAAAQSPPDLPPDGLPPAVDALLGHSRIGTSWLEIEPHRYLVVGGVHSTLTTDYLDFPQPVVVNTALNAAYPYPVWPIGPRGINTVLVRLAFGRVLAIDGQQAVYGTKPAVSSGGDLYGSSRSYSITITGNTFTKVIDAHSTPNCVALGAVALPDGTAQIAFISPPVGGTFSNARLYTTIFDHANTLTPFVDHGALGSFLGENESAFSFFTAVGTTRIKWTVTDLSFTTFPRIVGVIRPVLEALGTISVRKKTDAFVNKRRYPVNPFNRRGRLEAPSLVRGRRRSPTR